MPSNLLHEAIIDAEALKEAALKSAHEAVLEKYAPEIKKAIKVILEQEMTPDSEEDPLAGLDTDSIPDLGGAGTEGDAGAMAPTQSDEVGPEPSDTSKKLPMAATEGEKLCACPDEDEEIEINFDELERQMASDQKEDNIPDSMPQDNPNDKLNLKLSEEIDIDEDLIRELIESDLTEESVESQETQELDETPIDSEITELKSQKENQQKNLKEAQIKENKFKKVFSDNTVLFKENKELLESRKALLEENKKFKKTVLDITKRLTETNIRNAKLLYTNQVLVNTSLNERQKLKLVEAISKTTSVEEAKLIYETLQHSVGSVEKPKGPKSLNEVVQNKGGLSFPRREQENGNPVYTRMQKIAGITKK